MTRRRWIAAVAAALLVQPLAGSLLASEQSQLHVAFGEAPLCGNDVVLGRALLVTESAWRSDQKDADWRSAARALERDAFDALERPLGTAFMNDDARAQL